jgi:hypothetical protein
VTKPRRQQPLSSSGPGATRARSRNGLTLHITSRGGATCRQSGQVRTSTSPRGRSPGSSRGSGGLLAPAQEVLRLQITEVIIRPVLHRAMAFRVILLATGCAPVSRILQSDRSIGIRVRPYLSLAATRSIASRAAFRSCFSNSSLAYSSASSTAVMIPARRCVHAPAMRSRRRRLGGATT